MPEFPAPQSPLNHTRFLARDAAQRRPFKSQLDLLDLWDQASRIGLQSRSKSGRTASLQSVFSLRWAIRNHHSTSKFKISPFLGEYDITESKNVKSAHRKSVRWIIWIKMVPRDYKNFESVERIEFDGTIEIFRGFLRTFRVGPKCRYRQLSKSFSRNSFFASKSLYFHFGFAANSNEKRVCTEWFSSIRLVVSPFFWSKSSCKHRRKYGTDKHSISEINYNPREWSENLRAKTVRRPKPARLWKQPGLGCHW